MGNSKKTVVGVFKSRSQAEKAVDELQQKGFSKEEISILASESVGRGVQAGQGGEGGRGGAAGRTTTGQTTMGRGTGETTWGSYGNQDLSEGVTTGGTIGGLAGLLAGAGALAIPGIGPIIAAGPIAGVLSGAVTGGVAGGLLDFGIPQERGRHYESQIKEGNIVALVRADEKKVDEAEQVFRKNGATDVEKH